MSYQKEANGSLKVLEENNYYPFGLKHSGYNNTNLANANYKYKYNGKELQDELGLNLYDYGARNYDPAIGRWFNIDPLAEIYRDDSPYNYALNNPIYFIDPDGMHVSGSGEGKGTEDDPIQLDEVIVVGKDKRDFASKIFGIPLYSDNYKANRAAYYNMIDNSELAQQVQLAFEIYLAILPLPGAQESAITKAPRILSKIKLPALLRTGTIAEKLLTKKILEKAIQSSRIIKKGKTLRGVQALDKKINRGDLAYEGLKVTQENAEKIIKEVLESVPSDIIIKIDRNQQGVKVIDYLKISTGRGVRLIESTKEFDTFINLSK
ncbi:RHS repeat domain-containing protein [Empedobacter tilapiae]